NARGMFDFLLLRSIPLAGSRAEVNERANLLLTACEQVVAAKEPPAHLLRLVATEPGKLPAVITGVVPGTNTPRVPIANRPTRPEMEAINARLDKVASAAREKGSQVDPNTYLQLALQEITQGANHWDAAEKHVNDGLKAASQATARANNPREAERLKAVERALQMEQAWLLLLKGKPQEADVILTKLEQHKGTAGKVHLRRGIAALMDGRLEAGLNALLVAQQKDPGLADDFHLRAALAYAYMGLGKYDKALGPAPAPRPLLNLQGAPHQLGTMPDDKKKIALALLPTPEALDLDLMRCYLALGYEKQALVVRERLRKKEGENAAEVMLANYYTRVGRQRVAKDDSIAAGEAFDKAK